MKLRTVIDNYLVMSRKSRSELSLELGLHSTTMSRFLTGHDISQTHFAALLIWLLREEDDGPEQVS